MAGTYSTLMTMLAAAPSMAGVSLLFGEESIDNQDTALPSVTVVPTTGTFDEPGYIQGADPALDMIWQLNEGVDLYLSAVALDGQGMPSVSLYDHSDAIDDLRKRVLQAFWNQRAKGLYFRPQSQRWELMKGANVRYGKSLVITLRAEISIPDVTPLEVNANSITMSATIAASLSVKNYTQTITTDAPKLWWRFNDAPGSSVILDTMGFANGVENSTAATLYQQPSSITEPGQFAQGATNSAASYVTANIPAGIPLSGGWTAEWWTAVQPLAAFQNAVTVFTDGPSQVSFSCGDGVGTGSALVGATPVGGFPSGVFATTANYYAITYDGANTRFYKNGALLVTSAVALPGTRVNQLGFAAGATGGAKFGGSLDEVALYASALSASQLLSHYNAGIQ